MCACSRSSMCMFDKLVGGGLPFKGFPVMDVFGI